MKTSLAHVGYEMIITNAALRASSANISYLTRARGNYIYNCFGPELRMSSAYCLRFQERKGKNATVGFLGIIKTNKTEIDCYFKKCQTC